MLGGVANISAGLDADGRVIHFIPLHDLIFGEVAGGTTDRIRALDLNQTTPLAALEMLQEWQAELTASGPKRLRVSARA